MLYYLKGGKTMENFDKFNNEQENLDIELDIEVSLKGPKNSCTKVELFVPEHKSSLIVSIPNFVEKGQILRIVGKGKKNSAGKVGNLLLRINKVFYYDIEIERKVPNIKDRTPASNIILDLPHLEKTVNISIPNDIQYGQAIRLKGLGLLMPNGLRGDLYIKLKKEDKPLLKKDTTPSLKKLDSLIGLSEIKNEVKSMINLVKMQKKREIQGYKTVPITLHCVFTGNPGTGKTTVARILSDIYKEIGILHKGHLIEVDRTDLVGEYIGETAIKTQAKINEALGGILFIDEAYTLAKDGRDFGQEAIDTILKAMEDHRDELMVIVAGYDQLMKNFINSNPGLKSRFKKTIHFNDYNANELEKIFRLLCSKYQYELSTGAEEMMRLKIQKLEASKSTNFANARDIRNLFEEVIAKQATRLSTSTHGNINLITEQDFF